MKNDRDEFQILETVSVQAQLYSFETHVKQRKHEQVYSTWVSFYQKQEHQELLDALIFEHENDFPLRSSQDEYDQLRHKALVEVLQERAHTEFLKSYLDEISKN